MAWPSDEVRHGFQRELESELKAFFTKAYPKAEVRVILEEDGTDLSVRVKIDTPTGLMSVVVERDFRNHAKGEVYHSMFAMSERLQGQGISPYIQRKFLEYYDKIGITKIRTDANLDVGGYTWARYGFRPVNVIDAYGRLGFPEVSEDEVWRLWDKGLADGSLKQGLLGSNYRAELDLSDPARRAHYEDYIRKVGARSDLYKSVFDDTPPVAGTANEAIRDGLIRHQIGLTRVSGSIRNQIHDLLNATEADLQELLAQRLVRLVDGSFNTPAGQARLEKLLEEIRAIRSAAHGEAYDVWREQFRELAVNEPAYMGGLVGTSVPVILDFIGVMPSYLQSLVDTHPFEGKVLKEWADRIEQADIDRITQQVRIGLVQGETAQQIAARVVGTAALRGSDGVTEITRRDATAMTRTATNTFANEARKAFVDANSDIISLELFLATLDGRTTPICRSLDGNLYPLNEGPRPSLHWQCRSLRIPVIDGNVVGSRPMKASTERLVVGEYAKAYGLGELKRRKDLPNGHKGKFDEFSRRRVRELTGTTLAKTTYADFLGRQSAAFQDDVLGQAKGRLFRDGGLTLDKFVDRQGKELTLAQLARTEKNAFKKAGLDAGRYT